MALKLIGGSFPVSFQITVPAASSGITYEAVNTGLSVTDRIGWLLQKVEVFGPTSNALISSSNVGVQFGISVSNTMTFATLTDAMVLPQIKFACQFRRYDLGTAASGIVEYIPKVYDYTNLSDGGQLIVPQPLYGWVQPMTVSSATPFLWRAWFQACQLTDADYFNMLQANQMLVA